jgi:hypothetical protein
MDVRLADGSTGACRALLGRAEPRGVFCCVLTAGHRMRLWLFDAPQGSSMKILAVAIDVPQSQFQRATAGSASLAVRFAPK